MTRRDLELHAGPDPIRAAGDVQADDVLINGHQDAAQHVCCAHCRLAGCSSTLPTGL